MWGQIAVEPWMWASGSRKWVSQPSWVTRIVGRNSRSRGGTTASKAGSSASSPVAGGGRHDRIEGGQKRLVPGVGLEWQVGRGASRGPGTDLVREAGPGEQVT